MDTRDNLNEMENQEENRTKQIIMVVILIAIVILTILIVRNSKKKQETKTNLENTKQEYLDENLKENENMQSEKEPIKQNEEEGRPLTDLRNSESEFTSLDITSEEEFKQKVLNSKEKVLVDFYANWCGPCVMMEEVVENFAANADGYKVYKVNIDKFSDLAVENGVSAIPAFNVYENGEIINKGIGIKTEEELKQLVK